MEWVIIIIIGFFAGALAKLLMPGRDPGGFIITILLGIGGSILFSYLGQFFNIYPESGFGKFVGAVVGAIIILVIYRAIRGRQA